MDTAISLFLTALFLIPLLIPTEIGRLEHYLGLEQCSRLLQPVRLTVGGHELRFTTQTFFVTKRTIRLQVVRPLGVGRQPLIRGEQHREHES